MPQTFSALTLLVIALLVQMQASPAKASVTLSTLRSSLIADGSSQSVVLISSGGTQWTTTEPRFTLTNIGGANAFLSTQAIKNDQEAVVILNTGTQNGFFTLTDPGTNAHVTVSVQAPIVLAPQASILSIAALGDGTVSLSATPPTSGTAPFTYQWYRDTSATIVKTLNNHFSLGTGQPLSGATGPTLTDTGLVNGRTYFYALVVTDSTGLSFFGSYVFAHDGTTVLYHYLTAMPHKTLVVGFVGDSVTGGAGTSSDPPTPATFAFDVNALTNGVYQLPIPADWANPRGNHLNAGRGGTRLTDWLPTDSGRRFTGNGGAGDPNGQPNNPNNLFNSAVSDFKADDVQYVVMMLGTNDQTLYRRYNLMNVALAFAEAGFTVVLNSPPFHPDAPLTGPYLEQERDDIPGVVADINAQLPGKAFVGDLTLYNYVSGSVYPGWGDNTYLPPSHSGLGIVDDGVHATQIGANLYGLLQAKAFVQNVLTP